MLGEKRSVHGLRVVVLGSEKNSVASLAKSLIRQGALVSSVESPKKALKAIKDYRMNLLIVDDDAGMDLAGLMHSVQLLSSERAANIAAILLTNGRGSNNSKLPGFHEHLKKPISFDGLLEVIENIDAWSPKTTPPQLRS